MGEPITIRLDDDVLRKLEAIQQEDSLDRSDAIRKLLEKGYDVLRKERAAQAYREGKTTISEAAHRAGMTLWEMMRYLIERGYRSEYSIDDLERESLSLE